MNKKNLYYTAERNVQIVIALLKAHGIKRVIASPGTTNYTFIGSIQNDPWFEIWSCVDERSAAYMACGMAAETKEPVILSCTGATASRNYMPGLTEAYYRKLPVLALTSHRGTQAIGHLLDQQIDRRSIPNDIAVESVTIPMVRIDSDAHFCMIEANKAILALKLNGGGPVHINMFTEYSRDFSVKEIPAIRVINRYTYFDVLPPLPKVERLAVCIGSHSRFSEEETNAIDQFCTSNNAVVFCDHTSGYSGKFAIHPHLLSNQICYSSQNIHPDLVIHIGEILGTEHVFPKEVWRVSEDGALRDTYNVLTTVFMMPEKAFFNYYTKIEKNSQDYWKACHEEEMKAYGAVIEMPFSNIWLAQQLLPKLPKNSELHMGIYNSLRSWSFFPWPEGIEGLCNVGGFGIDGALSTLIGASFIHSDKLYFGVFGDLAFFYDMNSLGNRHVKNNVRILLINNGRGTEFRLSTHPCAEVFGEDADPFMAAAGHFGNQSSSLVRSYVEALGFEYLSASSKDEFIAKVEGFVNPKQDRSIVLEVFIKTDDETMALDMIQNSLRDTKQGFKSTFRKIVGKEVYIALSKLKN